MIGPESQIALGDDVPYVTGFSICYLQQQRRVQVVAGGEHQRRFRNGRAGRPQGTQLDTDRAGPARQVGAGLAVRRQAQNLQW